jgi:hypothetical protein
MLGEEVLHTISPTNPTAASRVVVPRKDGRIYFLSLVEGTAYPVDAFDTTTNAFVALPSAELPANVYQSGPVHVIGVMADGTVDIFRADRSVQYDPATNATTPIATTLPTFAFQYGQVVGRDGRLYVMGGAVWQSPYTPTNHLFIYDPATHAWSEGAPMPTARFALYSVNGPDGRIYAVGDRHRARPALRRSRSTTPPPTPGQRASP